VSDSTPMRAAIVGVGRMGRVHLEALEGSAFVRVVAAVDPRESVRAELAGRGLVAHAALEDLLGAGGFDLAIIAAPSDQHRQLVATLLGAGVPVLCEKPCGLASTDAAACLDAAGRSGTPLQVAYWRRYVPALVELRQRLLAGELGELLSLHCAQWDLAPPPTGFRLTSGGIFLDMGVHEFDQLRWLSGGELSTLCSVSGPALDPGAPDDPDWAQVVGRLGSGATVVVSLGRWYPAGDTCKVEVFGTAGSRELVFLDPASGEETFHAAIRRQAEDFAASLAGRASTGGASAADAVAALSLAERAAAAGPSS